MSIYKLCLYETLKVPRTISYNKNNNYTVLECLINFECKLIKGFDINENNKQFFQDKIILINNTYIAKYNEYINIIIDKLKTGIITIECIPKIKGGDGLIGMFSSIIQIGKVFIFLIDLIMWILKFIVWFIFFVGWLIKFLTVDLVTDFTNGMLLIIISIFKIPFDLIISLVAYFTNSIGGWMTSIWGWDQSNLTKNDKQSNYFKSMDRNKGKKCYLTNSNTVPFSILLGTILCPPLGVFMNLGVSGWFNILICILLTLLFYIPGLYYALIVIYA